jgi:hypothetical protein
MFSPTTNTDAKFFPQAIVRDILLALKESRFVDLFLFAQGVSYLPLP